MGPRNDLLDHAMDLFPPSEDALDRVVERHRRRQRNRRIAAGVVGVAIAIAIVLAFGTGGVRRNRQPVATQSIPPSDIGTVTITNTGCTLDGFAFPAVGPFTIEVVNETGGAHTFVVGKIPSDARFARMLAVIERERPRFGNPGYAAGHASEDARLMSGFFEYASTSETDVDPHVSLVISGAFDPGTYAIQCAGRPPQRDRASNFIGPIDVRAG